MTAENEERLRSAGTARDLGDGLGLEPLAARHGQRFCELVEGNREYLGAWMTWVWEPYSLQTAQAEIERLWHHDDGPGALPFAVTRNGVMMGFAQLFGIRFPLGSAEVSYWIDQAQSGQGVTTRAVTKLCRIAFDELGLHRVELRCAVDNTASRAVARKAGFVQEGILRDAFRVRGVRQSLVMHSRLAGDGAL